MTKHQSAWIESARSSLTEIKSPAQVLTDFAALSKAHPTSIAREVIGQRPNGELIEVYRFGAGTKKLLVYGCPTPNRLLGANVALAIAQTFAQAHPELIKLPIRWHIIPCLDLPPSEHAADEVEIDLCLDNPRVETRALLSYAERIQPHLCWSLHDSHDSAEPTATTILTDRTISSGVCDDARKILEQHHIKVDDQADDLVMGPGFARIQANTPSWDCSTYSILSTLGPVLICDIGRDESLAPTTLAQVQLELLWRMSAMLLGLSRSPTKTS